MASFFDRIEPETRRYLKRIFFTMVFSVGWMFANVIFGLAFELGYVEGRWTTGNILYYTGSFILLVFLVRWLVKTWGKSDSPNNSR